MTSRRRDVVTSFSTTLDIDSKLHNIETRESAAHSPKLVELIRIR